MPPLPELRNWQKEAQSIWFRNNNRGCIEVATGGGKTLFALSTFTKLLEKKHDLKIIVVVPTLALLDQWYLNFTEDLGFPEEDIKILTTSQIIPEKKINLVIVNTAREFSNTSIETNSVFLVVDECHRVGSIENSKALLKDTYASLGLSATPYREFDEGFHQYIEPTLGPVIFKYSLADAIGDGILAELTIMNVRVPLLGSEQSEYDDLTKKIGAAFSSDTEKQVIDFLLRKRARLYNSAFYRIPAILSIMENFRGIRSIIFLESISQANEALEKLKELNHHVTIYHSQLHEDVRRSNLRLFRKGLFDVLVACRALDEGFNVPEARMAIIGAGTSSKRQRIQRIGRVLRTFGDKIRADVFTIYATDVEEVRLLREAEELEKFVKFEWKTISHDK